jgi:hypothetical protein
LLSDRISRIDEKVVSLSGRKTAALTSSAEPRMET